MNIILDNRRSARIELSLVLAASMACWAFPILKWPAWLAGLPLMLAGVPWVLHLVKKQALFRLTSRDLPLGIFLITSGIGTWAAYNRELAWAKFWLIVAAVWLFYALSRQPEANLWGFAAFLCAVNVFIAIYFLLTHDWQSQPTKFAFIQQIGSWWMDLRPTLPVPPIRPNKAAHLIAVFAPFQLGLLGAAWKRRNIIIRICCSVAAGISFTALLLTASRGALLTICFVLGISGLGWFARFLAPKVSWRPEVLFVLFVLPLLMLGLGLAWQFPGGIVRLLDTLPGPASASSREEIGQNTLYLINDFFITGGGLRSFPGLYSQYILNTPYLYLSYSHNLFLEVALEQGIFGFLAFLSILSITFWLLWATLRARPGWLGWAALASLIVMCLHGLVTDAVYSEAGTPFIFFQGGIAAALARAARVGIPVKLQVSPGRAGGLSQNRRALGWRLGLLGTGLLVVLCVFIFRSPLVSKWYANLGAVKMARVELRNFPPGAWQDRSILPLLFEPEKLAERSLREQPGNPTANYRLGLIKSLQGDFPSAVAHLENALRQFPRHPGIQKSLGVNDVWLGKYDDAAQYLSKIPEADELMAAYSSWWETQRQMDLADKALWMSEKYLNNRPEKSDH